MTIDMRHLRCALAALDHGSMRKAAAAIGMRQGTLMRDIRSVETRIGYALYIRRRDGVHPTPEGLDFLDMARQIVEDMDMLTGGADAVKRGRGRRITIGFYTSVSTANLRATLSEFRRRHPDTPWKLVGGTRQHLLRGIERGRVDVAIVTTGGMEWRDGLLPLWHERCVAVLPAIHPLAAQAPVELTALRNERFLASNLDPGPEITAMIRSRLGKGTHHPNIVLHDTDYHFIKPFVGENRGVMIDCESGTGESLPGVVYREIKYGNETSEIHFAACWRKDNPSGTLHSFLSLLRERYPDLAVP